MIHRTVFLAALTSLVLADEAVGQNSIYSLHGVGFPIQQASVRARGQGSGWASFDPLSTVNPATIGVFQRLTAYAMTGTIFRSYTVEDEQVKGLTETRFPLGMLGGALRGTPVRFAISYSLYAERAYDLVTVDTVVIRGDTVPISDQISEDGAIADIRGALSYRVAPFLTVGGGFHILSGSSRLISRRQFADPNYAPFASSDPLLFSGIGFSGGLVLTLHSRITLSGAVRTDNELQVETKKNRDADVFELGRIDLPLSVTGGLLLRVLPALRLSGAATWRSWSDAQPALEAQGTRAFDTWEVGTGLELATRLPIRLGFRYAQLPFSPTDDRARELNFTLGTGLAFAGQRAAIDVDVERIQRDGAGVEERAWYVAFSVTVRP